MLAAGRPDLSARSASPTIKRAEDALQTAVSGLEIKSLSYVAGVNLNKQHRAVLVHTINMWSFWTGAAIVLRHWQLSVPGGKAKGIAVAVP